MSAPLRIAHVTSSLFDPLGGAEQYCIELARWQAGEGHRVELFGAGATPALRSGLLADGITVHDLARPRPYQPGVRGRSVDKVLFHTRDLADTVIVPRDVRRRLAGHDIVHSHRWHGLGAGPMRLGDTTTVHTVHDYGLVDTAATSLRDGAMPDRLPLPQRVRAAVMVAALRDLDRLIFPTRRTLERHRLLGLDLPDRSEVVPHGWRLPRRERMERAEGGPVTFTFMGKLMTDKGVDLLLEAWGDGVPGARLVFAGAGPLEERVAAIGGGVEFRGWLGKDAQAALLAETDVLVLPSLWPENFPLVVAEALLAHVPVLATTVSAPEVLDDGRNAIIAEPAAVGLRDAIDRVVDRRLPLGPLRDGAAASAEALDIDVHGAAVLAVYDRARSRHERRSETARR